MRLHLGLESMRERVDVAGGTLEIRSSPGEGATFIFTFPISAAADLSDREIGIDDVQAAVGAEGV
jgi:signal transduction histidine kinase